MTQPLLQNVKNYIVTESARFRKNQIDEETLHSSGQISFKGGSSGLGLALARGIVSIHNGRIWIESPSHEDEELPGGQFFVFLPVHQPQ